MKAQMATIKSKMVSLEQELQAANTSLESEKSCSKVLNNDVVSKTQSLLAAQQEVETLRERLTEVEKKAEQNEHHVSILASSCNESKLKMATKERVCMYNAIGESK